MDTAHWEARQTIKLQNIGVLSTHKLGLYWGNATRSARTSPVLAAHFLTMKSSECVGGGGGGRGAYRSEGEANVFRCPLVHGGEVKQCVGVGSASNAVNHLSELQWCRSVRIPAGGGGTAASKSN